ncbi:DUF2867 domain-containing protein [Luteimonas sp. M1R5S18]|uniref:DUF2867 domain-containing protein n=1 Tax=Luteimonas rhizosphaericola TaxID=3042024 RepID=A0ABT6JFY1_9GAMM|nr:DUF2867 domain-containing protein [Luteimonas rhizosphaericola]MDH5829597.1 DUF2867 domain-containing protein [Luteimonas rhizosphaericola]
MHALVHPARGFPMVRLPSSDGGRPVEVCLVAQLSPGSGDHLFARASGCQQHHETFVDALDEPSAKLFGVDFDRGERTAVYSFAVDAPGHPFHRHAGHRVFTAISGSGGAQLRFCTIDDDILERDPHAFLDSLQVVDVPPDSLFTVRFAGGTWHQFAPRSAGSPHPVFFALSCHTDELGGIRDPALAGIVQRDGADIPTLTQLLPPAVQQLLAAQPFHHLRVSTTTLSMHAAPDTLALRACAHIRERMGLARRWLAGPAAPEGFIGRRYRHAALERGIVPPGSLLSEQFRDGFDHEDLFALEIRDHLPSTPARAMLEDVLEGFLSNRPVGVSLLMRVRNLLVKPLRLRTSPLGCPVSSLLSSDRDRLFAGRYPVLGERHSTDGRRIEVLLGADDHHLAFRSSVAVEQTDRGLLVTLGTRVRCRNGFGRVYMSLIERAHRRYIAPTMLEMAVAFALRSREALSPHRAVANA